MKHLIRRLYVPPCTIVERTTAHHSMGTPTRRTSDNKQKEENL